MTKPDLAQSMNILSLLRKAKGTAPFLSMNIVKVLRNLNFDVKNLSF